MISGILWLLALAAMFVFGYRTGYADAEADQQEREAFKEIFKELHDRQRTDS